MGKHKEREKQFSGKNSSKSVIIIAVVAAIAVGIGVAFTFGGMRLMTSDGDDSDSRTVPWLHVHGLGIDPADPSILYIATHGDFYKSVGGETPVKADKQRADYMAFNSPQAEGAPLYASGHPSTGGNTGLIKSIDGGQTWERVSNVAEPPVDFHAMSVSKSDPNVIMGFDSGGRGLFKTIDAGTTWQRLDAPGGFVIALAISPNNANSVFAGTNEGLFQSDNGGVSWNQLNQYKGVAVLALAFDTDAILYASTETFGLAKSPDAGKSWQSISRAPDNLTATSIAADSRNNTLYVAGHAAPQGYQEVFKGDLSGSNWSLIGTNK